MAGPAGGGGWTRQWISGYWRPGNPYLAQASHSQLSARTWLVVVLGLSLCRQLISWNTVETVEQHHRDTKAESLYIYNRYWKTKLVSNSFNIKCQKYNLLSYTDDKLVIKLLEKAS